MIDESSIDINSYIDLADTQYAADLGIDNITRYLLEKGADKNKGESPERHAHNLSFDHTSFWKRLKYKRIANLIANHNTETMISDIWNSLNP